MASDTVYAAVRAHLEGGWTATPLIFENEGSPPDSGAWVFVEATGTLYGIASLGQQVQADNLYREHGFFFLWVMVESGTGTATARAYAKQLADLFRGTELSAGTLTFEDMSIGNGATTDRDGNWWSLGVTIDFKKDHTG